MNFLVKGKLSVYFALFLIALLVGLARLNLAVLASSSAKPLPERTWIKETTIPFTATTEVMTPVLTPTQILASLPITDSLTEVTSLPSLADFIQQVRDGKSEFARGFYVSGIMALRVVLQPEGDPGFISAEDGTATLFQSPSIYGVTGLLAHNFLSGREFFRLKTGQALSLIYGDGHLKHYEVSQIDDFQRLSPSDLRSNFLELSSGVEKTADQLFTDFYEGRPHLTLQTCIEKDGAWTWGVHFIKAEPVD